MDLLIFHELTDLFLYEVVQFDSLNENERRPDVSEMKIMLLKQHKIKKIGWEIALMRTQDGNSGNRTIELKLSQAFS